jgi:hypothetical protein
MPKRTRLSRKSKKARPVRLKFLGRNQYGQFLSFLYKGRGDKVAQFTYDSASRDYEVLIGKEENIKLNDYFGVYMLTLPSKEKLFESRSEAQQYMREQLSR